jgi:hypothetical protein
MESTRPLSSVHGQPAAQSVLQPGTAVKRGQPGGNNSIAVKSEPGATRIVGYGLPCAKCRTYYAADLAVCPICKSAERVPAFAPLSSKPLNELPDTALEEERERFLREFKSQVFASHMQINTAASFRCSLEENHAGGYESAAVCQCCYNHLQERVDLMEASLHMDLKEAAQIVYDAVWADSSDPNKTYQNAALALLTELRKRAGIRLLMGPLQPLPH